MRILAAFCLMTCACETWWWKVIDHHVSPPQTPVIDEHMLPFSSEAMGDLLDLTVRHMVVQDRAHPVYLHAEKAGIDAPSLCSNFVHETSKQTRALTHADIGSLDRTYTHYENPWLMGGALVAALSVRQATGEKPEEVLVLRGMLQKFVELSESGGEVGYLLRYDGKYAGAFEETETCRFPNGYCTTIDQGPYRDADDKYVRNALTRRWEPSGDEYVGLLVIISFVERYITDPTVRTLNQRLASNVASYLRHHSYYLERPCSDGGLVWRGGYHVIFAHAYERVFERMGLGYVTPQFPTVKELCERNKLDPTPYSPLMPCTPIMPDSLIDELQVVLNATQLPGMHNLKTIYESWLHGSSFPFLRIRGSGLNLIMFVLFAQSALFEDAKADLARFYREIQTNDPWHVSPFWHGMFAYADAPFTTADTAVRDALQNDAACSASQLPLEDEDCRWSTDATLRCVFPMTMLTYRAGSSFDRPISRDALPL